MSEWHRPLNEMLSDVFDALLAGQGAPGRVTARSLELKLPVEVSLREAGGEQAFIADVPVWRWRTDFDVEPGRLHVVWETVTS
jgi:hypothetical protein